MGGGNSLDNTLRVGHLVPTEWVLLDIQVHAVERGFGHGLVHMFAEDGTLLATASQSCIVRILEGELPGQKAAPPAHETVRPGREPTHDERPADLGDPNHGDPNHGDPTSTTATTTTDGDDDIDIDIDGGGGADGINVRGLPIRPGMTVPLPGPLHSHRDKLGELVDLGYTDIWSAESDGADAFTPLALAAAWEPRLRLGTAIVPAYTRSPACLRAERGLAGRCRAGPVRDRHRVELAT